MDTYQKDLLQYLDTVNWQQYTDYYTDCAYIPVSLREIVASDDEEEEEEKLGAILSNIYHQSMAMPVTEKLIYPLLLLTKIKDRGYTAWILDFLLVLQTDYLNSIGFAGTLPVRVGFSDQEDTDQTDKHIYQEITRQTPLLWAPGVAGETYQVKQFMISCLGAHTPIFNEVFQYIPETLVSEGNTVIGLGIAAYLSGDSRYLEKAAIAANTHFILISNGLSGKFLSDDENAQLTRLLYLPYINATYFPWVEGGIAALAAAALLLSANSTPANADQVLKAIEYHRTQNQEQVTAQLQALAAADAFIGQLLNEGLIEYNVARSGWKIDRVMAEYLVMIQFRRFIGQHRLVDRQTLSGPEAHILEELNTRMRCVTSYQKYIGLPYEPIK